MMVDSDYIKGVIGFCIKDFEKDQDDFCRGLVAGYESALRIIQSAEIQRDVPSEASATSVA